MLVFQMRNVDKTSTDSFQEAKEVPSAYGEFVSIRGTNSH